MEAHEFLSRERGLPERPDQNNIVYWRVFRSKESAESFIPSIRLEAHHHLVGGYSRDSVGPLWWVGVQVESLDRWGNRTAINKHAGKHGCF